MINILNNLKSGLPLFLLTGILLAAGISGLTAEEKFRSVEPLRPLPQASQRTMSSGPAKFVDTTKGDDTSDGSKTAPWKTLGHALKQLSPGDTLYLRGGTYYEQVYCSVVGTQQKPIVIRAYPGELAILDGGFREFFEAPETAWEAVSNSPGEFRSAKPYKNLRNIHGRFGDSMVGLQVYYHLEDLRGERYVGPGICYDAETGYIHARLAHYEASDLVRGRTELTQKLFPHRLHHLQSYKGETDPRKLPLIIAPFRSTPLFIDRAKHLTIQDLVVRGGGHTATIIQHGEHLELDNVTIYAGSYGLMARNTGPFKLHNSAIRGSVPPWSTRGESSLVERPWEKKGKNLTRLNTHALLIPSAGDEYSVYYFPYNNQWEISYCEFTDGHDGIYTGDIDGLKFHHNYLHNFQDDGVYLSCFRKVYYPQHGPREFYQNVISGCLMTFAFGGDARRGPDVHIYRNLLDGAYAVSDHGSPPWDSMRWYHNTISSNARFLIQGGRTGADQEWFVYNNLILTGKQTEGKPQPGAIWAGNMAGEQKFQALGDFRLPSGSPAINAGSEVPKEWPDPLRKTDQGKPDVGALPAGADRLKVGQNGRLEF